MPDPASQSYQSILTSNREAAQWLADGVRIKVSDAYGNTLTVIELLARTVDAEFADFEGPPHRLLGEVVHFLRRGCREPEARRFPAPTYGVGKTGSEAKKEGWSDDD